MKNLKQYIFESSEILYHFTNTWNLVNICKTDSFHCSEDDGLNKSGYSYFISTTRQKNALTGYPTGMMDSRIARIVLDGKKLNTKFKMGPISFDNAKARAIKSNWSNPEDYDKYEKDIRLQTNVEAEDRIYSKKEFITDWHKYVKEIQLDIMTLTESQIKVIEDYGKKYHIPVTLFTPKQFKLGRR